MGRNTMQSLSRTPSTRLRQVAALLMAAVVLSVLTPLAAASSQTPDETGPTLPEAQVDEPLFEESDQVSSATIGFSGTVNSANARWLVDLYDDVLQRPADLGGLDHWLALVAAGGDRSRSAVARSFLNSEEGARGEVVRAYRDLLDREPEPGGLAFWTAFLRTNPVTTLRFGHLASDEYLAKSGGTVDTFIESLYQDLLFRSVDSSGLAFYGDKIRSGTSRGWVVADVYRSAESMGNRVKAYYQEILGRQPTTAEITSGAALIRSDDERALRALLLANDEAFDVFYEAATGS